MALIEAFLQEWEQEAKTTRRVLERVPEQKLSWKPHAKSMSLGALAMHIASAPAFISDWAVQDETTFAGGQSPDPASTADILAAHDASAVSGSTLSARDFSRSCSRITGCSTSGRC